MRELSHHINVCCTLTSSLTYPAAVSAVCSLCSHILSTKDHWGARRWSTLHLIFQLYLPQQLRIIFVLICGWMFLFEHRESSRHHGSVSSLTTFISQNIIQTDSTSVRHRHINVEGKDHWIAYRKLCHIYCFSLILWSLILLADTLCMWIV